jgi:hypothetical protein
VACASFNMAEEYEAGIHFGICSVVELILSAVRREYLYDWKMEDSRCLNEECAVNSHSIDSYGKNKTIP